MAPTIDYYFAPQSPWTHLGHLRFWDIARRHGAAVRVLPVDLPGRVFPSSGGLPLSKRAPQRQAYRLVELKRWSDHLHAPLNLEPNYYPVNGDDAARLIIAVYMHLTIFIFIHPSFRAHIYLIHCELFSIEVRFDGDRAFV